MANQNTEVEEQASSLAMSDEDFLNAPPPAAEVGVEDESQEPVEGAEVATETPEVAETGTDDEAGDSPAEEVVADDGEQVSTEDKESKEVKPEANTVTPEKTPEEEPQETVTVDFEAEYKRLLTPFKANGKEFSVNNVDDAIQLMQMGVGFNKKMAALKPNLKLMRMLENNGLLSEDKISFLIDLDKKVPDAINKLVTDSGINPMDLDAEKAGAYKQSTYTVDDREIELDTVLDELKDSPAYNRTLDVVSTKWDGASKHVIAGQPQILKVINDHINSGIYDLINKEVESERVFGRLNGLSDIEAYRQVGDAIQARGGFNHLAQGSSLSQGKPETKEPVIVQPKPKQVDDDKLKDKRRAASSTKPVAPSSKPAGFSPLGMSDEEFSKQVNSRYL